MKDQVEKAKNWIKDQSDIRGCITGSTMLEYFDGADIDIFVYDEKSFAGLFYAMHHDPMFTILDPLEKWKADKFRMANEASFFKFGVLTIKYMYNTCIPVNIILKKNCQDIFSVLSSFDMDIISIGYDLQTRQYLDLSENKEHKIATWNKWNTTFYSEEIWKMSRILRQLERCFKYHKRGYNTDAVVKKYIEIIDRLEEVENIFNSEDFKDRLKITKENTRIVKKLCEVWLDTHEITDEQLELLQLKIKEL